MSLRSPLFCSGLVAAFFLSSGHALAAEPTVWNHPGLGFESIYLTGDRCGTVAAGDFDGDGDTDLAVASYTTSSDRGNPPESAQLRLWWNDGKAQFDSRSEAVISHRFATFCPIDVGGDGILDLAVADSATGLGIEIVRGLGGGQFAPPVSIAPQQYFRLITAADMNGDGRSDLIAATSSLPARTVVLLQSSQGAFVAAGSADTGPASVLTTGDFDGDGFVDVAYVVGNTGYILRGDGVGGLYLGGLFTYPNSFPPSGITTLVPADVDGNGQLDLLSGFAVGSAGASFLHLNRGGGELVTSSLLGSPLGGFQGGIAALDAGRDGRIDVFAGTGTSPIGEWRGNGLLWLQNAWDAPVRTARSFCLDQARRSQFIAADLDNDGQSDLVVTNAVALSTTPRFEGFSIVRLRPTDGQPILPEKIPSPWGKVIPVAFSKGGPSELVTAGGPGTYRRRVAPDRSLSAPRRISNATEARVLDVDGDGRDDLALGFGGDSIGIALTGKDGESLPISAWLVGKWLAKGDLDGDKRPEIVLLRAESTGVGEVVIAWSDAHASYGRVTTTDLQQLKSNRYGVAIDDRKPGSRGELIHIAFGRRYIAPFDPDTVDVLSAMRNLRLERISRSLVTPSARSSGLDKTGDVVPADVDGDGNNELVVLRSAVAASGRLSILKPTGNGGFVHDRTYSAGWFPEQLTVADLDGDGDLDVLYVDSDEGGFEWTRLWIRWNDGAGNFDDVMVRHLGYESCVMPRAAVADLDGDGVTDVAVALGWCGGFAAATEPPIRLVYGTPRTPRRTVHRPTRETRSPVEVFAARDGLRLEGVSADARGLSATAFMHATAHATLDLFDLSGRRVTSRSLVASAEGPQQIGMPIPEGLTRGIYWLVLRQGSERATSRVAILR